MIADASLQARAITGIMGTQTKAQGWKGFSPLERITIQRRASYLYARAYLKIVVVLTVVYAGVGVALGIISELTIDTVMAGVLIVTLGVAPIITMWIVYLVI